MGYLARDHGWPISEAHPSWLTAMTEAEVYGVGGPPSFNSTIMRYWTMGITFDGWYDFKDEYAGLELTTNLIIHMPGEAIVMEGNNTRFTVSASLLYKAGLYGEALIFLEHLIASNYPSLLHHFIPTLVDDWGLPVDSEA